MIGVIADDLTGAAELGGLATRLGMRAAVLLGGSLENQFRGWLQDEPEVVCIDTDTRLCSPSEAGNRAAAAAQRLVEAGASWIYKKVDSVLRGQVIPEMEAILEQLGYKIALLAPANPSLGRTIRNGKYFVGNRPIDQTEFVHDPAYPRTTADVLGLLGRSKLSICCRRPEEGLPAEGIVVAEAETSADVARWVEKFGAKMLAAGGAEFFGQLLKKVKSEECGGQSGESEVQSPESGVKSPECSGRILDLRFEISKSDTQSSGACAERELFVCGSMSESAREFVGKAADKIQSAECSPESVRGAVQNAEHGVRSAAVFSLPGEIADGALFEDTKVESMAEEVVNAFQEYQRVILQIGLPPVSEAVLAARLALDLARLAEAVLKRSRPTRVFAEGGATAVALARRMGWESFSVVRELAPGAVGLRPRGQEGAPELIMKPGSYRWPEGVGQSVISNQ